MSEYGTGGVLYAMRQNEQRIQGYVPQQYSIVSCRVDTRHSFLKIIHQVKGVPNAPHGTVRAVFPHTALQSVLAIAFICLLTVAFHTAS